MHFSLAIDNHLALILKFRELMHLSLKELESSLRRRETLKEKQTKQSLKKFSLNTSNTTKAAGHVVHALEINDDWRCIIQLLSSSLFFHETFQKCPFYSPLYCQVYHEIVKL